MDKLEEAGSPAAPALRRRLRRRRRQDPGGASGGLVLTPPRPRVDVLTYSGVGNDDQFDRAGPRMAVGIGLGDSPASGEASRALAAAFRFRVDLESPSGDGFGDEFLCDGGRSRGRGFDGWGEDDHFHSL